MPAGRQQTFKTPGDGEVICGENNIYVYIYTYYYQIFSDAGDSFFRTSFRWNETRHLLQQKLIH